MDMHTQQEKASILLIYTGGTIGMIENPETGVLESFNFPAFEGQYAGVEETGVFGGHDTVRSSDGLLGDGAGLVDEDRENHRR